MKKMVDYVENIKDDYKKKMDEMESKVGHLQLGLVTSLMREKPEKLENLLRNIYLKFLKLFFS